MGLPHLNATQIPNIIFDYWMAQLTPAEFKVLLCICRKTYGWHKQRDSISLNQISKITGLTKRGVQKIIPSLQKKGLIQKDKTKTEKGDDGVNWYEIHLDELPSGGGRELSSPRVGNSVPHGVGNSVPPQKKDYTKERLTKEKTRTRDPSSSSKKNLSKERAPKVRVSAKYHEKLVTEVGEEFANKCYQRLSQWKTEEASPSQIKKGTDEGRISRWVKAAVATDILNEKKVKRVIRENGRESNQAYAKRIAENYSQTRAPLREVKIEALYNRLFIESAHPTSHLCPTEIYYTAHGFKEQVENALRKWKLK